MYGSTKVVKSQNIVSLLFLGPTSHFQPHPLHHLIPLTRRLSTSHLSPYSQHLNQSILLPHSLSWLTDPFIFNTPWCVLLTTPHLGKEVSQFPGPFLGSQAGVLRQNVQDCLSQQYITVPLKTTPSLTK